MQIFLEQFGICILAEKGCNKKMHGDNVGTDFSYRNQAT
jgi:hypothetical protein